MKLNYQIQELPLEFTFTISRSSQDVTYTVLVEIEAIYEGQKYMGYGEAVPSSFYDEDIDSVVQFYQLLEQEKCLHHLNPFNLQALQDIFLKFKGHQAAKAGIDEAIHDIQGKILGIPLYQLWGLDPMRAPKTSYTIGISDIDTVKRKTETALSRGYDILKIKLGSPHDLETLQLIQVLAPHARFRVDANAAWTIEDALGILPTLKSMGVEFVEEPLLLTSTEDDYERLKAESPLPLMADESCHTMKDIPQCGRFFHAINLKPTKTGGLSEALRMIHAARAHNLKIMLGCFTETSVSITAFAHLSPLVDYADLDGGLLLAKDPFDGVQFEGNQICLPQRPGIGVIPRRL